jgi:hypothetical protein
METTNLNDAMDEYYQKTFGYPEDYKYPRVPVPQALDQNFRPVALPNALQPKDQAEK